MSDEELHNIEVPECGTVLRYGGPQGEEEDSVRAYSFKLFFFGWL